MKTIVEGFDTFCTIHTVIRQHALWVKGRFDSGSSGAGGGRFPGRSFQGAVADAFPEVIVVARVTFPGNSFKKRPLKKKYRVNGFSRGSILDVPWGLDP